MMQTAIFRIALALCVAVGAVAVGGAQTISPARSIVAADASRVEVPLAGASPVSRARANEIVTRMLAKNRERLAALDNYASERTYRVHYTGTGGEHLAEIHVHAEYTGPDQKHLTIVSESGSKFICEKVLRKLVEGEQEATDKSNRMQSALSPENYDVDLIGEDAVEPAPGEPAVHAWVLRVAPRVDNKFTYKGRVWISQEDYAVVRVLGEPAKNPSWWINKATLDSRYVRRGDIWLPAKNVSTSHVRIGGEATLTIDYGTYPVVAARALKPGVESAEGHRMGFAAATDAHLTPMSVQQ